MEELYRRLSACACRDRAEELEVLVGELAEEGPAAVQAQRRALWLLRKLAHPKHRRRYEQYAGLLAALAETGRHEVLARGLEAVGCQAAARFAG
jgi:hypothetical protein